MKLLTAACLTLALCAGATAQDTAPLAEQLKGTWVINEELSDNTDDQVEAAIKAGGGKVRRRLFSRRPEDFYRGGPPEQELYDRISYDDRLRIDFDAPEFRFEYEDGYQRVFYSDGRRRRVSANSFYEEGAEDYSLAHFEDQALIVEARPRDGGFTLETYRLSADGLRLTIAMTIQPNSFREPVELTRVFDRADQAR